MGVWACGDWDRAMGLGFRVMVVYGFTVYGLGESDR